MNVSLNQVRSVGVAGALGALAMLVGGCGKNGQAGAGGGPGGGGPGGGGFGGPPQVEVVTVQPVNEAWDQTYAGRVVGSRSVEVRPRVGGIIVRRDYQEGAVVKEGAELFQLDPQPYKVKVDAAQAALQRAEAQFRSADREWKRVQTLFKSEAVSERQRDQAESDYDLAKAGVAVAKADLEAAQLNLDYTTVRAPVSGATSTEAYNEGSLVTPSDRLTTITQLDPVYVDFSVPEGDPAFEKLTNGGEGDAKAQVQVMTGAGHAPIQGSVNFTDSVVNPQTGTLKVRAVVQNDNRALYPGEFVRVSFTGLRLQAAGVVPEGAVLTSARGSIVYVVGPDNTVAPRPVILGPLLDKGQLIQKGLQPGDKVITTSLIRIAAMGVQKVQPVEAKQQSQGAAPAEGAEAQAAPHQQANQAAGAEKPQAQAKPQQGGQGAPQQGQPAGAGK